MVLTSEIIPQRLLSTEQNLGSQSGMHVAFNARDTPTTSPSHSNARGSLPTEHPPTNDTGLSPEHVGISTLSTGDEVHHGVPLEAEFSFRNAAGGGFDFARPPAGTSDPDPSPTMQLALTNSQSVLPSSIP